MADDASPVPFDRRFRHGVRQHRAILSEVVLAAGVLLSTLAIGYFTPLSQTAPFPTINAGTVQGGTNYNLVFVIVGPIVAIVGAYLVGAYYSARRQFEHLMQTKSKAEFLRNIPELEELLWELTPVDEQRYLDKRADFRMRR